MPECSAKLGRHGVVEDRVDGAVHVDHEAAEEQEPVFLERLLRKRVVDDVDSVRHPQDGKHAHDDRQHLGDLRTERSDRRSALQPVVTAQR